MTDSSNEIKNLRSRIEELEKNLKESENKVSEVTNLAREIALSAVHHIRAVESESAELYGILEELQEVTLKNYVARINYLEVELKLSQRREREAVEANINIALSAKEHVEELKKKIHEYESNLHIESNGFGTSSDVEHDFRPTIETSSSVSNVVGVSFSRKVSVVKEGYMLKKSPALFKGWQSRYFVLTDDIKLAWYAKESDFLGSKAERGCIFLKDIPRDAVASSILIENEIIKIVVNGKPYDLNCQKAEVAKEWWHALIRECSR